MDDLLFNRGELGRALKLQGDRMREAVEAESEESLRQADVDEWAESLAYHLAVECPELKLEDVWREPVEDTTVDVFWDSGRDITDDGRARSFPGYRVVVHIPFEGDGNIFHVRTNTFTFNPPRGSVVGSDLIKTIVYARDTKPSSWLDRFLHSRAIRRLEHLRAAVRQRLRGRLKRALDAGDVVVDSLARALSFLPGVGLAAGGIGEFKRAAEVAVGEPEDVTKAPPAPPGPPPPNVPETEEPALRRLHRKLRGS